VPTAREPDRVPTVLVVDDEPTVRKLMSLVLEEEGFHVLTAENGHDAMNVSESHPGEIDVLGFPYPWLVFIDRSPEELVVPVPKRPDATVQIVPIDFVVQAAHYLGARSAAYGKRYHLVDPAPPTLRWPTWPPRRIARWRCCGAS